MKRILALLLAFACLNAEAGLRAVSGIASLSNVTGTLAVANGGTGVTTSTGTGSVVLNTTPTFAGTPLVSTASSPQIRFTDTTQNRNGYVGMGDGGFNLVLNAQDGGASVLLQSAGVTKFTMDTGGNVTTVGSTTSTNHIGAGTGLTGTAASLTAGNVTTNANLTGPITSVGNATTIATSPTITTPNITGTVAAGNATAGSVGEVMTATVLQGSAGPLTNNTAANVTSLTLTAGDWDCYGNVNYTFGATTTIAAAGGGINTVSATLGTIDTQARYSSTSSGIVPANDIGMVVPIKRVNVSGSTITYLVAVSTFAVSTNNAYGTIYCRRMR